jgi:hypothetical protein
LEEDPMSEDLADEVLRGAKAIAMFAYRNADRNHLRKVYHKHDTGTWPIWKDGAELVSTKTALREHFTPPNRKSAA